MGKTLFWLALGVVALMLVGAFVVSVLGVLIKFVWYLLVGAAVVFGGLYLVRRARAGVRGSRFRQLRR